MEEKVKQKWDQPKVDLATKRNFINFGIFTKDLISRDCIKCLTRNQITNHQRPM